MYMRFKTKFMLEAKVLARGCLVKEMQLRQTKVKEQVGVSNQVYQK